MNEWRRIISAKHRFHVVSFVHASACKLNHSRLNMYLILSHFLASSFPSIQFFFLIVRFIMCSTTWSGRFFASFSRVGPPKRQCSFLVSTSNITSTVSHLSDYEKLRTSVWSSIIINYLYVASKFLLEQMILKLFLYYLPFLFVKFSYGYCVLALTFYYKLYTSLEQYNLVIKLQVVQFQTFL